MENYLKDLTSLIKTPNDSKTQLRAITILNDMLEMLKKLERKKLTEVQLQIEECLFSYITNSRANSDICTRYIYYTYKHLFDFGLNSRLNDFINKYSHLVTSSKTQLNIKLTAVWLLGKVCCKSHYKSPQLPDLIHLLVKTIKNTNDVSMKTECFATLYRLILLKLPNFYSQINDVLKVTYKQEKYFHTEFKSKKNLLKTLDATIFYLNQTSIIQYYDNILNLITRGLDDEDQTIRSLSVNIYINMHTEKLFDSQINLQKIMRKKPGEPLNNFLEVLLSFGVVFTNRTEISLNLKSSYINIIKILFERNKDFINNSESLITKIYDLLISFFPLHYSGFVTNHSINYMTGKGSIVKEELNNLNRLNMHIEDLYRGYINIIYQTSYRKTLLRHIFKRLTNSQVDLDKIENMSSVTSSVTNVKKGHKHETEKENDKTKYNEFNVNAVLMTLVEFSESNFDIFELNYPSFQDISKNLIVYLISSVKSFRMLINRVFINLAYFIPSWRIPILTIILNFCSVAHAEVAALKNAFIYLIDENHPGYKYSLIIRNNLDALKDISSCLGLVLSTFSHKSHGVTVDMSNAALTIAKNMIIGKFADEEDNPKSLSLIEKTNRFNYSNADVDSHKEAGWIIIQGLCSMDYTWLTCNFKTLFLLWKYVFSDHCCEINEDEFNAKNEYKESLLSEFFIKKAALASLRKFILVSADFNTSQTFQTLIPQFLATALQFFIPYDKKKVLYFYKSTLRDKYKEAKILLYQCYISIPMKLFTNKLNQLLLPLCEEIVSSEFSEYTYEHIYANLNNLDTFLCERNFIPSASSILNSNNMILIDNFNIEKYNIMFTDRINLDINSKLIDSSVNLIVDIILESSLSNRNRQNIFKHFLTHMSEIIMKPIPPNDKGKQNKVINIIYCLFMLLKQAVKRNSFLINDESSFASSKMIFDIALKIDGNLIQRICAEGHSMLIKSSANPQYNINYYLTASECKFKNEINLDTNHFINAFYMIANIFRTCDFADILPVLDLYMNFIISYFNKLEDMHNLLISQSVYIITDVLTKNNHIDHARKMIEVFKMNYLFINKDNHIYFRDIIERNSLTEIRLMLLLVGLGDNIKPNEVELLKLILNKYTMDEKYRSGKIKAAFLYFAKTALKSNHRIKELVHNSAFLSFLMNSITLESNSLVNLVESFSFNRNLDTKFCLEILIVYLLNMNVKNLDSMREFSEKLVDYVNNLYSNNRYFYYNQSMLKMQICSLPHSEVSLFDKNSSESLNQIFSFLDMNEIHFAKSSNIYYNLIYINFHLIKLGKIFLRIYFEKKYNQVLPILNLMKELIQNQLVLYTSAQKGTKEIKADSLTTLEDNKEDQQLNKPLLAIRKMSKVLHINLKKFLIKTLKQCLYLALSSINVQSIVQNKNSNVLIEFLNYFMNSSMVLISCEESWEIKIKGVQLLLQIIVKFSDVRDHRIDDDSLLIQQYEAQISSCLKIIFQNSFSIDALFKGMKLLHLFISIPITTDPHYMRKINSYVDINLKNVNTLVNSVSERYDHLLLCKKLNFFCKVYLSTKADKILLVDVINTKVKRVQTYTQFLSKDYLENFYEYFRENFGMLFVNIYDMLGDFYIVLTQDRKFAKNFKMFQFIISGNRISYSHQKLLKYTQLYLKIISIAVNDSYFTNEELRTNLVNFIHEKYSSFFWSFEHIFYLIFYYINHFALKRLHTDSEFKSKILIYNEDDITDELREKITFNLVNVMDMLDVIIKLLTNTYNVVEIRKGCFFDIFKVTIDLFSLSVSEIDERLFMILEFLLGKWLLKIDALVTPTTLEEKFFIISRVTKFVNSYLDNKALILDNETITLRIIDVLYSTISYLISNFKTMSNESELKEYFYYNVEKLILIFKAGSNVLSKSSAGKLFLIVTLIEDSNLDLLRLFYSLIESTLKDITQYDKFFILFNMPMQYITKYPSESTSVLYSFEFIMGSLIYPNFTNRDYMHLIFKSLMIAVSQNFDLKSKNLLECLLLYLIESNYFISYFPTEDLRNLALSYCLTLEDYDKRRGFASLIIYLVNDNIPVLGDIPNLAVFCVKLLSKDFDYINELTSNLEANFSSYLNNLVAIQLKNLEIQKSKMEELKSQELSRASSESTTVKTNPTIRKQEDSENLTRTSSGGPKLKALKFKK